MCPMIFEPLSGVPMLDIGYLIESDRRTASDKLYITQLLPIKYSINVTNTFGGDTHAPTLDAKTDNNHP